jgi:hypothetical protein
MYVENNKNGKNMGLHTIKNFNETFYAVSQTKLQIINLNTVPTIICRGANDTDEQTE